MQHKKNNWVLIGAAFAIFCFTIFWIWQVIDWGETVRRVDYSFEVNLQNEVVAAELLKGDSRTAIIADPIDLESIVSRFLISFTGETNELDREMRYVTVLVLSNGTKIIHETSPVSYDQDFFSHILEKYGEAQSQAKNFASGGSFEQAPN